MDPFNSTGSAVIVQPHERERPVTMADCTTSRLVPQAHTQCQVAGFRSGIFSMSAQRPNRLPGTG